VTKYSVSDDHWGDEPGDDDDGRDGQARLSAFESGP
jgi:hypothetical protein